MPPTPFRYIESFSKNYDFKKKSKNFSPQIFEIYGQIILPKELDRELPKNYLYKEFGSD